MDTFLLNGKPVSDELRSKLKSRVEDLALIGIIPKLAAILVGDDPSSKVYVRNKEMAFEKHDCRSETYNLSANINEKKILELIDALNHDMDVHGILIQLPLPRNLDSQKILHFVSPEKDVDGFHPYNLGSLLGGNPTFIPCCKSLVAASGSGINFLGYINVAVIQYLDRWGPSTTSPLNQFLYAYISNWSRTSSQSSKTSMTVSLSNIFLRLALTSFTYGILNSINRLIYI